MSQTTDLFVCLRNRDFEGLAEWLACNLSLAIDAGERAPVGKVCYDGDLLVPMLQTCDKALSKVLLSYPGVCEGMRSKHIEHDMWVLDIAANDMAAWFWALEQGWGAVVPARPSVLKNTTIVHLHELMVAYAADAQKWTVDGLDRSRMESTWDEWLRSSSKRNAWLVGYMHAPAHSELVHLATCTQKVSLPPHFWTRLETSYPGVAGFRQSAMAAYAMLNMPYDAAEDKKIVGRAIGLSLAKDATISVAFEPAA